MDAEIAAEIAVEGYWATQHPFRAEDWVDVYERVDGGELCFCLTCPVMDLDHPELEPETLFLVEVR
jgi:hypothetical protein